MSHLHQTHSFEQNPNVSHLVLSLVPVALDGIKLQLREEGVLLGDPKVDSNVGFCIAPHQPFWVDGAQQAQQAGTGRPVPL